MSKVAKKKPPDRSKDINLGLIEAKNLAECLKVDFAILYKALFPKATEKLVREVKELKSLGILK